MPNLVDYIESILQQNAEKPFVDRILNRQNYPVLSMGEGNYATHKMSWGQIGNKYRVFPTILYDQVGRQLKEFAPRDAFNLTTVPNMEGLDNYIDFDTPEEADYFSKNYKSVWGR